MISGDKATALSNPNNIVLSQTMAERLFGSIQVIGETVTVRQNDVEQSFQVTGVVQNPPENSSIQFDIVVPFETTYMGQPLERVERSQTSWYQGNSITWIMLNEGASTRALEKKFPQLLKTHLGSFAENRNMTLGLQPLSEVYFSQKYSYSVADHTNIRYTFILAGIALIILTIAAINFMSFTLSRISGRHHEIGIRKAAGAESRQVGLQLLGEIFVTSGIALVLGILLAELLSPYFQQLTQKPVHVDALGDPIVWALILGIIPLITLITGIYPAIVISTKKASRLFGGQRTAAQIPPFVKGLTALQFALCVGFLVVTFVMQMQLNFMISRDLGFSPANVISIEFSTGDRQKAILFQQEAARLLGVQEVSIIGNNFNQGLTRRGDMTSWRSVTSLFDSLDSPLISQLVDEYYLETMGIELVKGHNFSLSRRADIQNGIIVNQAFVDAVGWQNPVGRIIEDRSGSNEWPLDGKRVIGVVENFNFQSLYTEIQPLVLSHLDSESGSNGVPETILVKVQSGIVGQTVGQLNELWDDVLPEQPFNYAFLDDLLTSQYHSEQRWNRIMKGASAVSILLACFGLFGMAALVSERRTREIGVRKVLGARVSQIVGLLSKDFMKLVLWGFVIAVPIAWYAMNRWLENFAYRIDLNILPFLIAGLTALLIAMLTVSWQAIRAARTNPVESLRSE